jgi:prepilin-type N-terminal cleavage/methylation domain-containing protein
VPLAASAQGAAPLPPVLEQMRDFRGSLSYVATREGAGSLDLLHGTLRVDAAGWQLDEATSVVTLHASNVGSYVVAAGQDGIVDDPFEAEPLHNAWAAALGVFATGGAVQSGPGSWSSPSGLRAYVNSAGDRLVGVVDSTGRNQIAYVFDDWMRQGALAVPARILRLRAGRPDAIFTITSYRLFPVTPPWTGGTVAMPSFGLPSATAVTAALQTPLPIPYSTLRLELAALVSMLFVAIFAGFWTRRDAFVLALCKRLARDPRGWRRAGTSLFVGPDGALVFDGIRYRVGPYYYNRAALVQCSMLFLRVSAPGVLYPVILPRRFRPIDLGIRMARGFTLVETLLAMALFAAVILLAVYPAISALSRAAELAHERAAATVIAANALADEEAAYGYGAASSIGSSTTTADGFTLLISIVPAQARGTATMTIRVSDANGNTVADLASLLGPPVKPPAQHG